MVRRGEMRRDEISSGDGQRYTIPVRPFVCSDPNRAALCHRLVAVFDSESSSTFASFCPVLVLISERNTCRDVRGGFRWAEMTSRGAIK